MVSSRLRTYKALHEFRIGAQNLGLAQGAA